jgi:hypothetical protein
LKHLSLPSFKIIISDFVKDEHDYYQQPTKHVFEVIIEDVVENAHLEEDFQVELDLIIKLIFLEHFLLLLLLLLFLHILWRYDLQFSCIILSIEGVLSLRVLKRSFIARVRSSNSTPRTGMYLI